MKTPTSITVVISTVQNISGNIKLSQSCELSQSRELSQSPHVNVLPLFYESNRVNTEEILTLEAVE